MIRRFAAAALAVFAGAAAAQSKANIKLERANSERREP
jgi:hypothetical protein